MPVAFNNIKTINFNNSANKSIVCKDEAEAASVKWSKVDFLQNMQKFNMIFLVRNYVISKKQKIWIKCLQSHTRL